jgi:hypothetical protein
MKITTNHDKTAMYLIENGWEKMSQGFSHPYLTEDNCFVPKEVAIMTQKTFDPVGYQEFLMLDSLDSKQSHMYSRYMDS